MKYLRNNISVYGSCGRDFSGDVGAFAITTGQNRNSPDSCIVRLNVTEGKLAIVRFKTLIVNCSTDFIEVRGVSEMTNKCFKWSMLLVIFFILLKNNFSTYRFFMVLFVFFFCNSIVLLLDKYQSRI